MNPLKLRLEHVDPGQGAGVRDKDAVRVDRQTDRHEHPSFFPNLQTLSKYTFYFLNSLSSFEKWKFHSNE